jgi:Domain of unknown function (DUF4132)
VRLPWSPRPQLAADEVAAWARHHARAGALVDELFDESLGPHGFDLVQPSDGPDSLGGRWRERLADQSPEVVGSAVMLLIQAAAADGGLNWGIRRTVGRLSRARWTVDREDALLAVRTAQLCDEDSTVTWALGAAVTALERTLTTAPLSDTELDVVRDLHSHIGHRVDLAREDSVALRGRLVKLLPQSSRDGLDTSPIAPVDGWSAAILAELGTRPETALVNRLVQHLAAGRGSKPTVKWRDANKQLVADDAGIEILQLMCERLLSAEPLRREEWYGGLVGVVDAANTDIAHAAVWALADVDRPWVQPLLQQIAAVGIRDSLYFGSGADKLPNASIVTLGVIASPAAIVALQQLLATTKHAGFRNRINGALRVAAESVGLTSGELVERTIDTGGLDHSRQATVTSGAVTATGQLQDDLTLRVTWSGPDGPAPKPPATAEKRDVNAIKRAMKALKDLVATERRRLEGLLAADRTWELTDWRRYYLEHPITGTITRRLIWTITDDTQAITGIPNADATALQTPNGDQAIPTAGTVTLWHPLLSPTDAVHTWRGWLVDRQLVQPFKQAYREVYLLTPAERQTTTYSNRFAAHILGFQQLYALTKERQWVANYLGPYEGGYEGRARKEFDDANLTAVFEYFPVDEVVPEHVELASTDRVWFHHTNDHAKHAVEVDEVPPLLFSEVMRDVDLFVSVTSIALDPTWADRGDDPHYAYWQQVTFGELSAVADVRRDVLAALLPKLKVSNRVELLDRYVRVRGNRATYKIHIGSANIMVEPDDRYVCIVPTSTGASKRIMLPFEGDNVLSVILSKIAMLAADDKITDASINAQIDART